MLKYWATNGFIFFLLILTVLPLLPKPISGVLDRKWVKELTLILRVGHRWNMFENPPHTNSFAEVIIGYQSGINISAELPRPEKMGLWDRFLLHRVQKLTLSGAFSQHPVIFGKLAVQYIKHHLPLLNDKVLFADVILRLEQIPPPQRVLYPIRFDASQPFTGRQVLWRECATANNLP